LRRAAEGSPHFEDGRARALPPRTFHDADPRGRGGALVHHRGGFGVSRSTHAVRAASEESKGAGRLTVARFDRSDSSALRVSHASRLATASYGHSANAANRTSTTPAPHRGAPRRGCRPSAPCLSMRARLEEPPEPSRPLSVVVAPGAPVCAVPSPRRQLAPVPGGTGSVHPRSQSRDHTPGLERHVHDPDTLPSYR